jgi:uncharacterized protein
MGLYAENHALLKRVFEPESLGEGSFLSSVGDSLDVQLDVITRHRYTLEMRLSYRIADPLTGQPDPSAYVRFYEDARQAEATHCYVGRHWQDVLGVHPPSRLILDHRLRMNVFLGKWLQYLKDQSHGRHTLRRMPREDARSLVACA